MNKTKLQNLIANIYNINKRFLSAKSAFVKELESFLDVIPDNYAAFLPDELNVLQSILKAVSIKRISVVCTLKNYQRV